MSPLLTTQDVSVVNSTGQCAHTPGVSLYLRYDEVPVIAVWVDLGVSSLKSGKGAKTK